MQPPSSSSSSSSSSWVSSPTVLSRVGRVTAAGLLIAATIAIQACATANGETGADKKASASASTAASPEASGAGAPIDVTAQPVIERSITRTLRVTGSLTADEQAEVSAETSGRIIKTPVERGSHVGQGALLVQIAADQTAAQVEEAQANADRIRAGLALGENDALDVERVPNVANAKAELTLAEADFARFRSLLDQRIVSQAEFDQQRTRVEAARQRYEAQRNTAQQDFRSLGAARARVTMARKSLGDTTVRAPFAGVVVERKVSVGDYVSPGTQVATVVRINPLRVLLTVPEQSVGLVKVGQPVSLQVDTYPNRAFTGTVRFVSPSLRADQRALTVEALVPNPSGELKPGFFATAHIEQSEKAQALLIDRRAIREVGKTSRVFVLNGDTVQERIVTLGQPFSSTNSDTTGTAAGRKAADQLVEVVSGLSAGDRVAIGGTALTDGAKVNVRAPAPGQALSSPAGASAPVVTAARK
jgi:RND family efflux transporter MFP subunit